MSWNSTYNPLRVSFKCCSLLSSSPARLWTGLSALSEYLTTSGRWNWLSSFPMNSERRCNEITEQQSRWDNVTLTEDLDGSHHASFFYCERRTHIRWTRTRHERLWMWTWSRHINTRRSCKCGSSHKRPGFLSADMMPFGIYFFATIQLLWIYTQFGFEAAQLKERYDQIHWITFVHMTNLLYHVTQG